MPRDDREVFEHLCADKLTSREIGYLAYAKYAFEKYEWMQDYQAERGEMPSQAEIDAWISQITRSRFVVMREEAARLFDVAAREYLKADIEAEKEKAVNKSILAEVRAAGSVWKQLLIAVFTSILAPLILGGVIVAALTWDRFAPTAAGVAERLRNPPQQENPGK